MFKGIFKGAFKDMFKDIFSFISSPLTQWLKNNGEVKAAKHTRKLAVINNQARLATDEQSNNHEWEMANLQDKDNSLRWCSFWLFALPILLTVFFPGKGAIVFTNLELVPQWWIKVFVSMVGGIWGIVELKKSVPQLIAAIRTR
jgi:hypothetical protein